MDRFKAAWINSKDSNIQSKLKHIKAHTKDWKLSTFGDLDNKIRGLEEKQTIAGKTGMDYKVKQEIRENLDELYRIKATMLYQKSCLQWQLSDEKNTKFLHKAILEDEGLTKS